MITVLKIGGSLVRTGEALRLRTALAERRPSHVALVIGGGEFADAVRDAQRRRHFSDATAHRMALMAMDMMTCMFVDGAAGFDVAADRGAFEHSWSCGNIGVWAPLTLATADAHLPARWDVTSDSLAAWLAAHLAATHLLVVKSCAIPAASAGDAPALAAAGIVDAYFPHCVQGCGYEWHVVTGADAALAALHSHS